MLRVKLKNCRYAFSFFHVKTRINTQGPLNVASGVSSIFKFIYFLMSKSTWKSIQKKLKNTIWLPFEEKRPNLAKYYLFGSHGLSNLLPTGTFKLIHGHFVVSTVLVCLIIMNVKQIFLFSLLLKVENFKINFLIIGSWNDFIYFRFLKLKHFEPIFLLLGPF